MIEQKKKVNYAIIEEETDSGTREVYRMMRDLIAKHHHHLVYAKIVLAWQYAQKPDKDGIIKLGQCRKASDLDRQLHDWDFIILLNFEVWNDADFGRANRLALLDHELTHAQAELDARGEQKYDENNRPCWRIRKHDIEEFSEVVDRHGIYNHSLEEFAKSLLMAQREPLLHGDDEFSNSAVKTKKKKEAKSA